MACSLMAQPRKINAPGRGGFPSFPARQSSLDSYFGPLGNRIACDPYQTAGNWFASMSFLGRPALLPRRGRALLPLRRRRRRLLLLPGAELLLLVLLLLCVSFLHRSYRLGQRMRPLLPPLLRNGTPARLRVPGPGLRTLLRLRSPLRFPHSRLRLRLVASSVGLSERTEPILRLRLPRHRHRPPWRLLPHQ